MPRFPVTLRMALAGCLMCAFCMPARAQTRWVVGDGIVRYDASLLAKASAPPSLVLVGPLPDQALAADGIPGEPSFGTEPDGRRRITVTFPASTSLYGTGLVTGPLERTGRRTTLYNTDAPGWTDANESLYQSHPWVLAVHDDGSATGVLFDSLARSEVDTSSAGTIVFRSEQQNLPVYVINRPTPLAAVRTLYELTGKPAMPPLWALGYHQSKGSYTSTSRLNQIAGELRSRRIPADVLWLDVGYMDGFRMFTFDPARVPDPLQLTGPLNNFGFDVVPSLGGFIRLDTSWSTFHSAVNAQAVITLPDGVSPYVGDVWPGPCVFVDPMQANARQWYRDRLAPFLTTFGFSGAWIDMNEPAVFNNGLGTVPDDRLHLADAAFGGIDDHARYHNAYGKQLSRAAYEAQLQAEPTYRPFTLSRAGALGGQRYGFNWTGDNRATWYHVEVSVPQVLNLGLSGQPFSGPDIGGYLEPIDEEMYRRWMGIGTMLPFARQHTAGDESPDKEPWVFGRATERISRLAIQRRYRLLPHLYTLAYAAHTEGEPIVRPVFFADPADGDLRTIDDSFLLGEALLVATAPAAGAKPNAPEIPGGTIRFGFREMDATNSPMDSCEPELPELHLRRGHLIPFHSRVVQSTKDGYGTDCGLIIAFDEAGLSVGTLYEDAGDGFEFDSGDYLRTTYRATRSGRDVLLEVDQEDGFRPRPTGRMLDVRLLFSDHSEYRARVEEPSIGAPTLISGVPHAVTASNACSSSAGLKALDGVQVPVAFLTGPVATQTQPTAMGDNQNELNQLFADLRPSGLRLGITGNLSPGATLVVLVDADARGSEMIAPAGLTDEPGPPSRLPGMRMDSGFAPESALLVTTSADRRLNATLIENLGDARVIDAGFGPIEAGNGALVSATRWPVSAPLVAYDDGNTRGVSDVTAAGAFSATRGFELELPAEVLTDSGAICAPVRVFTMLLDATGAVGNQALPPLGIGTGFPIATPDFSMVSGQQFVEVAFDEIDFAPTHGSVDFFDALAHLAEFDAGELTADIDRDGELRAGDPARMVDEVSRCNQPVASP